MSETAPLEERIAQLEALVARLTPAPPPPVAPLVVTPREEPRPTPIYTLAGCDELPRDRRAIRQLVEALAVVHRVSSPSREIPASWTPQLRRLAASRAAGRSWREGLGELGLELPVDLTEPARAVTAELDGLWDRLLLLTGLVLDTVNSTAKITLTTFLKRVLA